MIKARALWPTIKLPARCLRVLSRMEDFLTTVASPTRVISTAMALSAFAVAVLAGLSAGNPSQDISALWDVADVILAGDRVDRGNFV